jgi:redox-sensitive bicupin YhaK (pirin superfamily)
MAHATIESAARLNISWSRDFNALVYVLSGHGSVGPVGHPVKQGQLAVLGAGDRMTVTAEPGRAQALDVLLLGGLPIREPVFHYGPFVMNTRAEVIEALEDYQAGNFRSIPPNAPMPHRGGGTL